MTTGGITLLGDRGRSIGMGHAMRLNTLASALMADSLHPQFLLCGEPGPWDEMLRATDSWVAETVDIASPQIVDRVLSTSPGVVVIDSYSISREAIASLEASGARVVLIDDNGEHSGFPSSVIVNPNPHGRTIDYRPIAGQHVFTGAEWILIRPDVLAVSSDRNIPATGWVIAIGGTDPGGLVEQVRRLLPVNESVVVAPTPVGPLPPPELSGALSRARGAVIAAGSTAWEALFLGTPIVAVVTADNQELVGGSLRDDFGVDVVDARVEGWEKCLAQAIAGLGQSESPSRRPVDGRGAERLSGVIRELLEGRHLAVE